MEYPKVKPCLNTSENDLVQELYQPCLQWASRFDRGVGYFTTGWLTHNIVGLSDFASRGGIMRLITSPILSNTDSDAIIVANEEDHGAYAKFEEALSRNVDDLKAEMEADILNAFSWMLYDGIIEMKFAIPCKKLGNGDFHDKFGIFYREGEALSFSGSINDSIHGFQNYESIKNGHESTVTVWDCVTLTECKTIVTSGNHWTTIFEDVLTRPEEKNISGNKDSRTEWLHQLNTINNKLTKPSYSVSAKEFELIKSVYDWLK